MDGDLFMRLSGFYRVGPDGRGEPEFGYRDFRHSDLRQPIQNDAAAMIRELLAHRRATPADDLRAALEVELAEAQKEADADFEQQSRVDRMLERPVYRQYTPAMKRADRLQHAPAPQPADDLRAENERLGEAVEDADQTLWLLGHEGWRKRHSAAHAKIAQEK